MTVRHLELVDQRIDVSQWQHRAIDPDCGAEAWFFGVTRQVTCSGSGTRFTDSLFYDAHRPMALTQMERLADEAIPRFELRRLVLVHRLGEVPVGQISVAVGCRSPHRKNCFESLAWIMDRIKSDVPIWKRERDPTGETRWIHPKGSAENQPQESSDV